MKHIKRLGRGMKIVIIFLAIPSILIYVTDQILSGNETVTIITAITIILLASYLLGIENSATEENRSVGRKSVRTQSSLAASLEAEGYKLARSDKYEEVYIKDINGTPHYVTLKKEG